MFRFFESLIKPFPPQEPQEPPKSLYAFCRHYTRGTEFYLGAMAVFTGLIAILEVSLFGYLGQLVDLLNNQTPASFWQSSREQLLLMAFII